jgi:hypothetical protein
MSIDVTALEGHALGAVGSKDGARFIREFIEFPKRLYSDDPHWVPWFDIDMRRILERRHPFFQTGSAEFFLAGEGGSTVGRIMVLDIPAYRQEHGTDQAFFYFFDFDSDDAAESLFAAAESWAKARGRTALEGPFLFGGTSGTGLLVEGFDSPPPMTMMLYNRPSVPATYAALGFERNYDLISAHIDTSSFTLSDRVARAAELVRKRSGLRVLRFRNKREILRRADGIADLYNATLGDHPEDYPLSPAELEQVKQDLLTVARPDLVKILADGEKVIGFLFAFPDLSPVLRKAGGRLDPLVVLRLLAAMRRPQRILVNGMGILKEYRKRGGNALLYAELAETILSSGVEEAELVQVAESTDLMLADLETLGARVTKRYRVFKKKIC